MRKFLTLLFVLGAVAGVFYLVGLILPRVHTRTARAEFTSQPTVLYDAIADIEAWDEWGPDMAHIERQPDRRDQELFEVLEPDGDRWLIELGACERPLHFQVFFEHGSERETFRCELHRFGEGSTLRVTEQGSTPDPWRRALHLFRNEQLSLTDFLGALGRRIGENVKPEDV